MSREKGLKHIEQQCHTIKRFYKPGQPMPYIEEIQKYSEEMLRDLRLLYNLETPGREGRPAQS